MGLDQNARILNSTAAGVSVVIPCYNPREFVFEAIDSARRQTHAVEIILVNDGSTDVAGLKLLEAAALRVDRYMERPNGGPAAARNTGIREARGDFIVPLDCDDTLHPEYVAACLAALNAGPAAYVYTNYRVAGGRTTTEVLPEYNLYTLLDQNMIPYAALYRKEDWEAAGGYDEELRPGYEDWEFWLKLGTMGRYGCRVSRPLFTYRKHGPSLYDAALASHDKLVSQIRAKHAVLYSHEGRAAVKARWSPAVCIVAGSPVPSQAILDCQYTQELPARLPPCTAVLLAAAHPDAHAAEYSALAVWSGRRRIELPDGSIALAPDEIARKRASLPQPQTHGSWLSGALPVSLHRIKQHMANAELLSKEAWLRHPLRSAGRLIPLRFKETVNRTAGRPVFDLTFYLQFQTRSLVLNDNLVIPLEYLPQRSGKARVAFVVPHLGAGGAEAVALEMAASLDRDRYEILTIAAYSRDDSWRERWRSCSDHIYDLLSLCDTNKIPAAMLSVLVNWAVDSVMMQNTLAAYSIVPHLRRRLPGVRLMDVVHSVHDSFDVSAVTRGIADTLDLRVVISSAGRDHLRRLGVPDRRIRLIRNGVDLSRFLPAPVHHAAPFRILFAGRLDPVKRPLLLPNIANALLRRRRRLDFQVIVAGDGQERQRLRAAVRRLRLDDAFDFRGYFNDSRPLLAESDVVLIPSSNEGIPLIALEAMATSRPIVASRAGAIDEAVGEENGILIDPGPEEVERFAEALDAMLTDMQWRSRMGREGRAKAEAVYDRNQSRVAYRQLFQV